MVFIELVFFRVNSPAGLPKDLRACEVERDFNRCIFVGIGTCERRSPQCF